MIKSIKKVVVVGLTAAMTMSLLTSCGTKKSGSGEKYKRFPGCVKGQAEGQC